MAHEHSVTDSDKHFIINTATREITNGSGKVVLMQHDHNSERFTFELPKIIEGHDMSRCNQVQIHYQNKEIATDTVFDDVYEVNDFQVSTSDPIKCTFSWLISGNATQYVGALNFSVRFACVADDGTIEYAWNTAAHNGIMISSCFYNSEAVVAAFSDALAKRMAEYDATMEQWYQDLYLASIGQSVTAEEARAMLGVVSARTATVTLPAASWANKAQTVNVAGVTADNIVVVTHAPGSYSEYVDNFVHCTGQANGTLSFACSVVPSANIEVNVAIFE